VFWPTHSRGTRAAASHSPPPGAGRLGPVNALLGLAPVPAGAQGKSHASPRSSSALKRVGNSPCSLSRPVPGPRRGPLVAHRLISATRGLPRCQCSD